MLVVGDDRLPLRSNGKPTVNLRRAVQLQKLGATLVILSEDEFLQRIELVTPMEATRAAHPLGEAARLAGVRRDQLRSWVKAGLVKPSRSVGTLHYFNFRQVAAIRRLQELLQSGVSARRLQHSLKQLQTWLPQSRETLPQLDQFGSLLAFRRDDGRLADVAGQLLMDYETESDDSGPVSVAWPTSEAASDPPETLFEQGVELEMQGRLAEAAECYRLHLREHGPDAAVCFNLANTLQELDQYGAAIERYRQAVELEPDFVEAWNNMGDALAEFEQFDDALTAWKTALQWNPHSLDALYNLAETLESLDRCEEARPYWKRYVQLDPHSEWAEYAQRCLGESSA